MVACSKQRGRTDAVQRAIRLPPFVSRLALAMTLNDPMLNDTQSITSKKFDKSSSSAKPLDEILIGSSTHQSAPEIAP
jgi:hypothetical protein